MPIPEDYHMGLNFDSFPSEWVVMHVLINENEDEGLSQFTGASEWDNDDAVMEDTGPPVYAYGRAYGVLNPVPRELSPAFESFEPSVAMGVHPTPSSTSEAFVVSQFLRETGLKLVLKNVISQRTGLNCAVFFAILFTWFT